MENICNFPNAKDREAPENITKGICRTSVMPVFKNKLDKCLLRIFLVRITLLGAKNGLDDIPGCCSLPFPPTSHSEQSTHIHIQILLQNIFLTVTDVEKASLTQLK